MVGPKANVVVIDDDEGIRWVLQEMLSQEEIPNCSAESGSRGLELVVLHRPSLAIVDVKLGVMSGLDVARRIRDHSPGTQILFVTGYSGSLDGKIDQDLPVVGVVEKPFDVGSFLELVKDVLSRPSQGPEDPDGAALT